MMNKNGVVCKSLFSMDIDGAQILTYVHYNTHTEHIGIYSSFQTQHGWNGGVKNNKLCSLFLNVVVAKKVLVKIFKNVEVMPPHNKGYGFICGKGYKIAVKSATIMKTQGAWLFRIKHNQIADYFLCIAFDNRESLNPEHLWLIPAEKVNHLSSLGISEARLDRWSRYELGDKLNKVIGCCNIMQDHSKKPIAEPTNNIEYL